MGNSWKDSIVTLTIIVTNILCVLYKLSNLDQLSRSDQLLRTEVYSSSFASDFISTYNDDSGASLQR